MNLPEITQYPIPEGARPVVVTTKHKGLFFGYTTDPDDATIVTLYRIRCGIRWGTTGGFLQLADTGPTATSKVGARAKKATLQDVTAIIDASERATAAWEAAS